MASLGRVVEKLRERRGLDGPGAPRWVPPWPRGPAPVDVPEICSRYPTAVLFCGMAVIGAVLVAFVSLVVLVAPRIGQGLVVAPAPGSVAPATRGPAKMKVRPAANAAPTLGE